MVLVPAVDHRMELGARAGVMFGGEITPKGFPRSRTSTAPMLFLDASWFVHPYFMVGAYLSVAHAGYQQMIYDELVGDGSLTLVSGGASFKARFSLNEKTALRVGALVGRNAVFASGTADGGGSYDASGGGWNIAPTLEAAYRISPRLALTGQLGFISQPSGSVTVDGDDTDLAFVPQWIMAVGLELYR
jgi:hypothetical protein